MSTLTFDKQAMQGDVFIKRIDSLPDGTVGIEREAGRVVLAHGEVTGHAHAISEQHVQQFRAPDGAPTLEGAGIRLRAGGGLPAQTYLVVEDSPCMLRHEEHSPIQIQPGVYQITRQREYVEGEIRNVAD